MGRVQAVFGVDLPIRAVPAGPAREAVAEEIEWRVCEEIVAMPEAQAGDLAELNPVAGG